jgi:hypothetical protein
MAELSTFVADKGEELLLPPAKTSSVVEQYALGGDRCQSKGKHQKENTLSQQFVEQMGGIRDYLANLFAASRRA